MRTEIIESFHVMGQEARTTNEREMSGQGEIGRLWSKHAPAASPIVVVYSDYASDKDGEYGYLLGIRMGDNDTWPRELARKKIEAGEYVCLHSDGPVTPEVVVGLWQQIWEMESAGKIQRAYKTDFELYTGPAVDLYVGVST